MLKIREEKKGDIFNTGRQMKWLQMKLVRYIKYTERGGNPHILFLKEIGLLSISSWFWLAMSLSWRLIPLMHAFSTHQRREHKHCVYPTLFQATCGCCQPLSTILNINSILCFAATNSLLKCTQKRQQRFWIATRGKPPPSFLPFISNSNLKV